MLFLPILFLLLVPAYGQDLNPISFSLRAGQKQVAAGVPFEAVLTSRLDSGWHLYSTTQPAGGPIATSISVPSGTVFEMAGNVKQPSPRVAFDQNFGVNTEFFEGQTEFQVPVRVKAGTPAGKYDLPLQVRYMLCNDTMCLPPQTVTLKTSVEVAGGAMAAVTPSAAPGPGAGSATPGSEASSLEQTAEKSGMAVPLSTMAYVWFAMAMGALALLTPCVFPMIPITVSYFTKRQAVTRKQAVGEAALYSFGIILTFTVLGFGLTFLFGAGGINRLAASPFVNIGIAAVFILFALSLFGALEIRLPSSWLTAIDRKSSSTGGVIGIMLMALTFSLTSFTCTVPFVGTVMVAALQGNWLWSLIGITSFAAVFSAPFFLLALFPSVLQALPRSGNWMNSVKVVMGFLELAAALKFVSNVDLVFQWELFTRPVFIAIWLSIALVTAIYLIGWFRFPHEEATGSVGSGRVLGAIFFISISFYLLRGLLGFPLGELDAYLPPRDYGNVAAVGLAPGETAARNEETWLTSYPAALKQAGLHNRPIFIDFTGYTCTNCRWMEANMFPLPEVQDLFSKHVLVRLYTDGTQPQHSQNLQFEKERFGTIALPFYAILSPQGKTIATFPGLTRDRKAFLDFLRHGMDKESEGTLLSESLPAN